MEQRSPHERITLRIPPDLHRQLIEAAESTSPPNSLNSEILRRLYDSFQMPNVIDAWEVSVQEQNAEIRRLAERVAELERDRK